jgi:hypothetical protein
MNQINQPAKQKTNFLSLVWQAADAGLPEVEEARQRLAGPFKTDVPDAEPEEALEINCKLVYLYYLTTDR